MAALEIIIGHALDNIIPYTTKSKHAMEFIILNDFKRFIVKEVSKTKVAIYPTHSAISIPKNSILQCFIAFAIDFFKINFS